MSNNYIQEPNYPEHKARTSLQMFLSRGVPMLALIAFVVAFTLSNMHKFSNAQSANIYQTGLYLTGVSSSGAKLSGGSYDQHYSLDRVTNDGGAQPCQNYSAPPTPAVVVTEYGGMAGTQYSGAHPWSTFSSASWIGANSNGRDDSTASCPDASDWHYIKICGNPLGVQPPANTACWAPTWSTWEYIANQSFAVTADTNVDPSTIQMNISGSADNELQVIINGTPLPAISYAVNQTTDQSTQNSTWADPNYHSGNTFTFSVPPGTLYLNNGPTNSMVINVRSGYDLTGFAITGISFSAQLKQGGGGCPNGSPNPGCGCPSGQTGTYPNCQSPQLPTISISASCTTGASPAPQIKGNTTGSSTTVYLNNQSSDLGLSNYTYSTASQRFTIAASTLLTDALGGPSKSLQQVLNDGVANGNGVYAQASTSNGAQQGDSNTVHLSSCAASPTPFFSVLGGDVAAGPGFLGLTDAGNTAASITGENHNNQGGDGSYFGAGSQLGALATGSISSFATALSNMLVGATYHPYNLSFANTGNGVTVNSSGNYGGNYTGNPPSTVTPVPNYFTDALNGATQTSASSLPTPNKYNLATNLPAGNTVHVNINGNITLTGGTLPQAKHVVMTVAGNVYINSDILYAAYSNIGQIPSFQLIVQGNIYIDPGVKTLEGFYVAEPTSTNDTTNGVIATCANASGPLTASAANSGTPNCGTYQLTVNGAVSSRKLVLGRGMGDSNTPGTSAAEVFQYTPELWAVNSGNFNIGGNWQSITSLPPIL